MGYMTQQRACKGCIMEINHSKLSVAGSILEDRKRKSKSVMKQKSSTLNVGKESLLQSELKNQRKTPSLLNCGLSREQI